MKRKEIVEKAVFTQFPFNNEVYRDKYEKYNPVKFPIVPGKEVLYTKMGDNSHHYTLDYHFKYVIPELEKLLGFKFDTSVYKWRDYNVATGDLSRWIPKKSPQFEVYDYISREHKLLDFNGLQPVEEMNDKYRALYRYPHSCSRIINHSIDRKDERLMVTGDSQSIPDIPYLAMYFREVWYFDNRTGWRSDPKTKTKIPVFKDTVSYCSHYKDVNFAKVLVQFYCSDPDRYFKVNLK